MLCQEIINGIENMRARRVRNHRCLSVFLSMKIQLRFNKICKFHFNLFIKLAFFRLHQLVNADSHANETNFVICLNIMTTMLDS